MILSRIELIEADDGEKDNISLASLESLVKSEGLEKEAAEMFQRKRKYIRVAGGDYIRLVWKRETPNY